MKISDVGKILKIGLPVILFSATTTYAQDKAATNESDASAKEDTASEKEEIAPEKESKPSWTDHLKLKGDFRYRLELIDQENKDFRHRHRIRARVGLHADIVDGLKVVVQLGTGGSGDPVSNNQTLTESFSSKPVWLDLAYFEWKPSGFEGFNIRGGKFKDPFYSVGKTELIWDSDLTPEGLTLGYRRNFGLVEPFIQGAGYWIEERKEEDDAWMFGAQAGLKFHFLDDKLYFLAGAGYYNFTALYGQPALFEADDTFGNSSNDVLDEDGEVTHVVYAVDFDEVQGFGEIGGKIGRFPWAVFGDYVINTAVDEERTGWLVGGSFGKCKKPLDFALRYSYRQMQRDAVVGLYTDSDFIGGGTEGTGHEANLSFQPSKLVVTGFSYFYNQLPIDDSIYFHRVQVDLKIKF
jgi:putative porin